MGLTGYITILVVVVYLGFELFGLHKARDRMEPGYVFNEFVGARRAAEACGVKDSQKAAFVRNFVAVKARALDALLAAEPDTDAAALLATREQAREAEVDALIAAQSCGGKEVWRLLKLHEIRSNLDLR